MQHAYVCSLKFYDGLEAISDKNYTADICLEICNGKSEAF